MYNIPIYQVELKKVGEIQVPHEKATSPAVAAEIIKWYLRGADREHFVVLFLNTKNRVRGIHTCHIGCLNSSVVHPREVFKPAILANSAGIIVGHNHPSGECYPSPEDIEVTMRLHEAGNILGVELLDHIIVAPEEEGGGYFSMREDGVIK